MAVAIVLTTAALIALAASPAARTPAAVTPELTADEAEAIDFCGTSCHALPDPSTLPREAWLPKIERMARIRSGTEAPPGRPSPPVELPPDMAGALEVYAAHAPAALPVPQPWPLPAPGTAFDRHGLAPAGAPRDPAVSHVSLVDVRGDGRPELVVSDMRHGLVLLGDPARPGTRLEVIAQARHPARATAADLDRDGRTDLLIADLGEFLPADHDKGAVAWLRQQPDGSFQAFGIGGFPRVSDVQAGDLDGDGDLDLVVSAFGFRSTGQLLMLENGTTDWTRPAFAPTVIDARTGALETRLVDLDNDGRLDIVAAFAQQHEEVCVFLNLPGGWKREVLWTAPHPNWGTAAIDVADLDADGDLDVIVANGDTFDDNLLKPYHSVAWLENRGRYPFVRNVLAVLPGVLAVRAVDLDRDGDLDVVASALSMDPGAMSREVASIALFEHTSGAVFIPRTLELGRQHHATIAAGDVDGDGHVDLAVGNMATGGPMQAWVEIWKRSEVRGQSSEVMRRHY